MIKLKAVFDSQAPRLKCMCQGEILKTKIEIKESFWFDEIKKTIL